MLAGTCRTYLNCRYLSQFYSDKGKVEKQLILIHVLVIHTIMVKKIMTWVNLKAILLAYGDDFK